VRAVLAESYERIHRSNLVGMGILPLQFADKDSVKSLGLDGTEQFSISAVAVGQKNVTVSARRSNGEQLEFETRIRIDTPNEFSYYQNGGILHYVLRRLAT
jgi:aconitate hydratase